MHQTYHIEYMAERAIDNLIESEPENITELLCKELRDREQLGIAKYGDRLKPFIGDDADEKKGHRMLNHALAESLDLSMYLRTKMMEEQIFVEACKLFVTKLEKYAAEEHREEVQKIVAQFFYLSKKMGY